MSTVTHAGSAPSALAGAVQRFNRWRTNRRAIRALSHMSDADLSDMGLTRSMIGDAVRHGRR
jgi:uncharacterized protein YjiS (DUF1127 family)